MPNEYGSRPCCRLINTALARGARPARLRRAAAAHRVPARRWSRTRRCGGVLWARSRQLAPRRNKAAALCRPNASLCCHLRSLLVLIDTIGATSPPCLPKHLTLPHPPLLSLRLQTGGPRLRPPAGKVMAAFFCCFLCTFHTNSIFSSIFMWMNLSPIKKQ